MKDAATVRDIYQEWLDEIADLEPRLERIRTRLDQLRTLTTTMAQLDEMRAIVGVEGETAQPHDLDASGRAALDGSGQRAVVQTDERTETNQIDIRDGTHQREVSTSDAIIAVLQDTERPMGPRDVLDEMIRRGTDLSGSSDPLKLVNTHLGRMHANDTQPVSRVGRGRYVFDPSVQLRAS